MEMWRKAPAYLLLVLLLSEVDNLLGVLLLEFDGLAAVLLFVLILPGTVGCTQAPQRTGQAAIEHFLSCIAAKDYAGAYALLSASVRNDGEEPKSNRVTEKEFTDKYTNIFDALGITAIEYSNLSVTKGEILCKATFDAVYASEVAGNMENSFLKGTDLMRRR